MMEAKKEIEDEKPKEVIGETFMQGCFSGKHYTRAKYRCPNCRRRNVGLEDGLGREFPTFISVACESCQTPLIIRPWTAENK
jgi:hypothetical protein